MSRPVSARSVKGGNNPDKGGERPASANSRQAWSDDGVDIGRSSSRQRFDEDDYGMAGMELDDYMPGIDKNPDDVEIHEDTDGCWYKFTNGLRSIWATRQTEDGADRELYIKTTLRELVIYFIFLVVLCVLTFGMTSSTMYYYTKVMGELFLDSSYPETKNTFRGSNTIADFWRFAESPLMDGLYWETWYNSRNLTKDEFGYIYYESKLLGVPRLRQVRVSNTSCTVADKMSKLIDACYVDFTSVDEDKTSFGVKNGSAWKWTSEADLDGSGHQGVMARYPGSGFTKELSTTKAKSLAIIKDLRDNRWIDRGTRAVFVDFTVYNANINLFCIVRLLMELPATGGAVTSWQFRTVKLIRYVSVTDYFVMACECIFILFIIYYLIEEIIEIKKHKLKYFKEFWNLLDVIVLFIAVVCIAFSIYRTITVGSMLDSLLRNPNQYADFEFLAFWQTQFNNAIAVMVFFAWVKVFKYISFNKTMTQLSSTLSRCAGDLLGFFVMYMIVYFAFAQLGYLLFGTQVKDFSDIFDSFFTLFRIVLGDFDFHALESANRVLGPTYFFAYVLFVFFILLNMFLAIINDTYAEVKSDVSLQQNEFEMSDYFKKGYQKMMDKMKFKGGQIMDLQKVLNSADMNNDSLLDFDEWRADLKKRGYADTEIEALFAKYDADGDRVLDAEEQRQLQEDLHDQKAALSREFADLQEKKAGGEDMSDSDEDEGEKRSKSAIGGVRKGNFVGVTYDEYTVLVRRVDRMEHSIGSIVSKIDAVLVKLETMENAKTQRRETMNEILDQMAKDNGTPDAEKRAQMEKMVEQELQRWDSEADKARSPSVASISAVQRVSPSAASVSGARQSSATSRMSPRAESSLKDNM